jgi:hypothetical protein
VAKGPISGEENRRYFEEVAARRASLLARYLGPDPDPGTFDDFAALYAATGRMDFPFSPDPGRLRREIVPLRERDEAAWASLLWKLRLMPGSLDALEPISPFSGEVIVRLGDRYDDGVVIQTHRERGADLLRLLTEGRAVFARIGDSDFYRVRNPPPQTA